MCCRLFAQPGCALLRPQTYVTVLAGLLFFGGGGRRGGSGLGSGFGVHRVYFMECRDELAVAVAAAAVVAVVVAVPCHHRRRSWR